MERQFGGKVALVTGGASGIGRASALAFAAAGAAVVVSDIVPEGGQDVVRQIGDAGGESTFIQADVSQAAEVAALMRHIVERYGRLDYAHNNAGIEGRLLPFLDYPDEVFDRVIAVNLRGVWLCLKAELPLLLAQGGGAIVNTASIAGQKGTAEQSAYNTSKHGVIGLTRCVALEFKHRGVRVNAVCPGVIDTPMVQRAYSPEHIASVAARQLGRLGTPEEVAQVVVWLCSDAASFVTGTAVQVDGGFMA
jgi:NAD(P)-dependent dehydrogenase (short-subunit alcohol dehydrogenase family)